MEIVTNNVPRHMIYGCDLPEKVKKDFDWIDPEDFDCADFIQYKGRYYALDEFMRVEDGSPFAGWGGYCSDSYFSGMLVKIVDDDSVIVGRYYS